MTLEELMKTHNLRITNGDKWLVWGDEIDGWIVYQQQYAQKKSRRIYSGYLQGAIDTLIG